MNDANTIAGLWQRLETWAEANNAAEMLKELNPGASEDEIDALEEAFGHALPKPYRDSLATHNGEHDGWPCRVFADMGDYLDTAGTVENWQMLLQITARERRKFNEAELAEQLAEDLIDVEGPVRPLPWSPHWLPILVCNGDVYWALDYEPAEGGQPGQVIRMDPECGSWSVVAPDFETFFREYVEALEAGEYEVQDGLATKEPYDPEEEAAAAMVHAAFDEAPGKEDLAGMATGDTAQVVGARHGTVKGDRCELWIRGGAIKLRGSLRGSNFNQMLRVTIRIGPRRGFGLLGPVHEIIEWEFVK
ncbi:MAG: SMI1/KNR4 family protein [Woeseiaceae bacterium]|nr:SMI1/KNR4 family protein [Woeseiaceae bacterium]